jgi:hypothetical protein
VGVVVKGMATYQLEALGASGDAQPHCWLLRVSLHPVGAALEG